MLPSSLRGDIVRYSLTFAFLFATACFAQTPSALESDPQGWQDIMPNASFAGWTRLPFMTQTPMAEESQWKVDAANHVLICEGDKGHEWLRYDKELGDAIFHVEFRFTPVEGKKGYNSGVMLRNSADGAIFHQAQAGEQGTGYLFGSIMTEGKPARYNLRSQMKESRVKPAGEWNVFEITAKGPALTAWVNGAVVSEQPESGTAKGYAGLEAEGYRIEFRNIKIKELK